MPRRVIRKGAAAVKKAAKTVKQSVKRAVKKKTARAKSKRGATAAKAVGDVLGVSQARVPAGTPRATADRGGNPKGIEVRRHATGIGHLRRARVRW